MSPNLADRFDGVAETIHRAGGGRVRTWGDAHLPVFEEGTLSENFCSTIDIGIVEVDHC